MAHLLPGAVPGQCLMCHGEIAATLGLTVRHAAAHRPQSCSVCHSMHHPSASPLLRAEQQPLCLSCHGKDDFRRSQPLKNIQKELKKPYLHGPVAEGLCSVCHDPHGSSFRRLLSAPYPDDLYSSYAPEAYGFCFGCHSRDLLGCDPARTGFRDGDRNLHAAHVAEPRKGRTCRACHAPHAADNPGLIRSEGAAFGQWQIPVNFRMTATGGSCSPGCHADKSYDRTRRPESLPEDTIGEER